MNITSDDIKYLVLTVYGEARGESTDGKEAVAAVILNRANKRKQTPKDVCLAKWQFSCWNVDDPNFKVLSDPKMNWGSLDMLSCMFAVICVLDNDTSDIVKEVLDKQCTHYCTKNLNPYWAKDKEPAVVIGNHKFFNNID